MKKVNVEVRSKDEQFFFYNNQENHVITKKKIIIGGALGLFYSFVFYSFLYAMRESIRCFSITDKYDVWILSDNEVNFYNLFFAFMSLIFAQSISLSYLFGTIRKPFEKTHFNKSAIINNQIFLNILFFNWFTRVASIYACLLGTIGFGFFYIFSFYPKYNYLFILMLIVLFLQTWIRIRHVYKRKALKWMFFSAIIISILAFGLSKINLIDYHKINDICLNHNIAHKYNVELADVNTYNKSYYYYSNDIYLVKQQSNTSMLKNPFIIFNGKELSLDDLQKELINYINSMNKYEYLWSFRLHIDKSINMSYVNRLKETMTDVGIYGIEYAVIPKDREYDKRFYSNLSFAWLLADKNSYKNVDLNAYKLLYVYYLNDSLIINDINYSTTDFYTGIKQQFEKNSDYVIIFTVDDEMSFYDYIFVLSELKRAVDDVRNEYAKYHYATEYYNLPQDKLEIIRKKTLLRVMEIYNTQ